MFLNSLYLLSYQRGGVWLSNVWGAHSQPRVPLSQPRRIPYSILSLLVFWLLSVTATGNKMLVRVCAVALEHQLWYIVRTFASISWLPCHWLHVYWLGVNKARASAYFALAFLLQKVRLPLMWKRYIVREHKRMCCNVSFAPSPLFCIVCAVQCGGCAVVFTLTRIVNVKNKLKA